ncbi:MAG: STAS domain-containing protein [Spirochaetota bacterium]
MAQIACKKNSNSINIEVSGNATMVTAEKSQDLLRDIISGPFQHCHIDLKNVTAADLSFLQLLISFQLSMLRARKTTTLEPLGNSHPFVSFLLNTGFNPDEFFKKGISNGI